MKFMMHMVPPTATGQMKKWTVRNGKPHSYEPPAVKDARAKLAAHLSEALRNNPIDYDPESAIELLVMWSWPMEGELETCEMVPKTTKPDTDNLQKILKDEMTKQGFWKDDALVWHEDVRKVYSNLPSGVFVRIENGA